MELKNLSSNWKKLQVSLSEQKPTLIGETSLKKKGETPRRSRATNLKRKSSSTEIPSPRAKRLKDGKTLKMGQKVTVEEQPISTEDVHDIVKSISRTSGDAASITRPLSIIDRENEGLAPGIEVGKYIAIDCEMVGVGPNPDKESALARVSAVNFNGDQVYDSYVRPKELVTDWRTHVSGIQAKHMVNARSLEEVQKDIAGLLEGRVLVGHAIRNDLQALLLSHPKRDIRDTAKHLPFRRYAGGAIPKLKVLASEILGVSIQSGEHSSVEDARASMLIFRKEKDAFETELAKKWRPQPQVPSGAAATSKPNKSKTKKKSKRSKRT